MSLLQRGWSPTSRQRVALTLAAGFLLVVNPAYVGAFNLDLSGQTYAVQEIRVEEGRITTAGDGYPREPFDGIGCSGFPISVGCALERKELKDGDLRYEVAVHHLRYDEDFAFHTRHGEAGYYRRVPQERSSDGQMVVLEPVEPRRVLRAVAVQRSDVSLPVRLALATGSLQADSPPPEANRIIATDEGYVTLVETRERRLGSGRAVETAISAAGVLVGLVLLRRGYGALPAEW